MELELFYNIKRSPLRMYQNFNMPQAPIYIYLTDHGIDLTAHIIIQYNPSFSAPDTGEMLAAASACSYERIIYMCIVLHTYITYGCTIIYRGIYIVYYIFAR